MNTHQKQIQDFYSLQEQKDLLNWIELWSEDAESIFPYANSNEDQNLYGKETIKRFWLKSLKLYARLSISIKHVFIKENRVAVLFQVKNLISNQSRHYSDLMVGVFEFTPQGLIKTYTEFFNPIKLQNNIKLSKPKTN